MTDVAWNVNVRGPFFTKGNIALPAEFVPQAGILDQPIHGVEQLLVGVEDKTAAALLNNLRHPTYISHNGRCGSCKRFKDDDPEHLIPNRRNNGRDGLL